MAERNVQPGSEPTGPEALAILKRARAAGHLPEGFIERELGAMRGETGNEVRAAGRVEDTDDGKSEEELAPEQAWLVALKSRFDSLPQLHQGVQWTDVEKTLKADPEAARKLQLLDEAGFEMNVFGEKNGEIVFRTAQTDVTKIASRYRTIMADKKAQTDYPQYRVNGNAEEIAAAMGVEVADPELYEQYRVRNGWVWLKTDAATRATGGAFRGDRGGVLGTGADNHNGSGSFCAALRVKKA